MAELMPKRRAEANFAGLRALKEEEGRRRGVLMDCDGDFSADRNLNRSRRSSMYW